jgi:hypothetical protein
MGSGLPGDEAKLPAAIPPTRAYRERARKTGRERRARFDGIRLGLCSMKN